MATLYTSNDPSVGFDAAGTGGLPANWTAVTGSWSVGTTNLINGHAHSFACTTAQDGQVALLTGIAAVADMDVVFCQKYPTNNAIMGAVVRADGASYNNGYLAVFGSTTAYLFKRVGGSYSALTSGGFSLPGGSPNIMVRLQCVGTTVRVRLWSETAPEPTTWLLTASDGSVTAAGYAGLYNAENSGAANGTVVSLADFTLSSTAASFVTADTPANQAANAGFTLTGTYGGTAPTAMDVSFNGGASWAALTSFATGSNTWSGGATAPGGNGLYYALVRDHNSTGNTAASATFSVTGGASIGITTPGPQNAGVAFSIGGTYGGTAPASLNYEVDSGGFAALAGATISGGTWSGSITIATGGFHTVTVQESPATSVMATSGSFNVASSSPSIAINTPGTVTVGQSFTVSGTYQNAAPTGLNYRFDGGGYVAASGATIAGGNWSFTAIAPAYGTHTITVQEANATSVTATSGSFNVAVAPNDAHFAYSPLNWNITAAAATTINAGAYVSVLFSGATCVLNFNATCMCSPPSEIWWRIDGAEGAWTQAAVAGSVSCTVPASTSGNADIPYHLLEVVVKSTTETQNRWNNVGSGNGTAVIFTGLTVANGASLLAPLAAGKSILCYGDSITEGVRTVGESAANDTDRNDAMTGWAHRLGPLLGAEVAVVGFGATGLSVGGSGGVPALGTSFSQLYSGVPRAFAPAPNLIVINIGTNDGGTNTVAAMIGLLNGLLSACPGTPVAVLRPFNGNQAGNLQAAIAGCNNPGACHYIDTTGFFNTAYGADSLNLHPAGPNNLTQIAPQVAAALRPLLYPAGSALTYRGGFQRGLLG